MSTLFVRTVRIILAATLFMVLHGPALAGGDPFANLKTRLIEEGAPAERVTNAFSLQPDADFKAVARTMVIRESKLNYGQFLEPGPLGKAHDFLRQHRFFFDSAETRYEVDRYVIAAILLVETQLGGYTGNSDTLSMLATFAIMDRKDNRDRVWKELAKDDRKRWTRERFDAKLKSRAEWAWEELSHLFRIEGITGKEIRGFKGSVMGAIGWPQFLPSSIVKHAVDGSGDGVVDLFTPADAIHSVANYLKDYGWKKGLTREEKEKVIWEYNHSTPYVKTILDGAEKLRAMEKG